MMNDVAADLAKDIKNQLTSYPDFLYNTLQAIGRLMYKHTHHHPVFRFMGVKFATVFVSRTKGRFDDLTQLCFDLFVDGFELPKVDEPEAEFYGVDEDDDGENPQNQAGRAAAHADLEEGRAGAEAEKEDEDDDEEEYD